MASNTDPGLYIMRENGAVIYLLVYVDDILLASKSKDALIKTKASLADAFDIRDLGAAGYFLGMELVRDRAARTIKLSQHRMTEELVTAYGMADSKNTAVPMPSSTKLHKLEKGGEALDSAQFPFSALVGSLLYLSVCTRPDIAYSVGAWCGPRTGRLAAGCCAPPCGSCIFPYLGRAKCRPVCCLLIRCGRVGTVRC